MARMTEDDLLRFLNDEADKAYDHVQGVLAGDRTRAMKEYLRLPYGNEEEGRSNVVASDVFDSVESILPDLVEVFVATDEAVRFDPTGAEDEAGAKQATDACNYVFYKQNNGFIILYTAAKDALMMKTGGVKWYWEEKRTPDFTTYRDVPEMQLALFVQTNPKAQIVDQEETEIPGPPNPDGSPGTPMRAFTIKVKTVKTKGRVRVVNIPPDELRVSQDHNSILLDECRYVAHVSQKTLSDIVEMGYKVDVGDVKAAETEETTTDRELRNILQSQFTDPQNDSVQDESQTKGWLREEYVLCDFDGDGIAERRRIMRLGQKVLDNVECSHVQMAAWTPYILTHRFEGLSMADLVSDFQRMQTEILRQSFDGLALANSQETVVLTNPVTGAPYANIDDLLNRRPGGVMRETQPNAIRPYMEHWKGVEATPMVEMLNVAKENRTGYTRYSQGLDANSLNKTKGGLLAIMNASQKRVKMMARIMAEALVAPMFRGIFKTLTDYCMEKLSFRLNGNFVQYDPQEWRDAYDMTINVGIGTGDKEQQTLMLNGIEMAQAAAIQGGGMGLLVTPKNIYNLQKRKVELAGFKDANEFWTMPPEEMPKPPPPPPDPKVQIEGAKLQQADQHLQVNLTAEQQKFQAEKMFEADQKERDRQLQLAIKMMDQRHQMDMLPQPDVEKEDAEAQAINAIVPQVSSMLDQTIQAITQKIDAAKPETVEKIRDKAGRMIGARITQADGTIRDVTIQ
jgi:hypothetical protein